MNRENLSLRGRVAVVTGGSKGIGRAIVELLSELGAHVVVNYASDKEGAEQTVHTATNKGVEAVSVKADVSNVSEAHHLVDVATSRFGRIDILVCNAGIWEGAPVDEMDEQFWDRTLDTNLKGTWAVCQASIPVMKQQGSGNIVVITSTAGQRGEANYSNYAASKSGQIGFVKSLAAELAPWRIRVNGVAPGWVDTEMTRDALGDEKDKQAIGKTIPLGAVAKPEEVAAPAVFLCTEWASHITGEILNVNGGSVLCG